MAKLRNGLRIQVNRLDLDGRELLLFGLQDPVVLDTCRQLIEHGDSFVDIGANHGAVGLLLASELSGASIVHLVEPQPELQASITACLKEWRGAAGIKLHGCALGDRPGTVSLQRKRDHSGGASIVREIAQAESISVELKDTTSWLRDNVADVPFGAKLDVEGAEHLVLPGLLAHPKLKFVVFEAALIEDWPSIGGSLDTNGFFLFGLRRGLLRAKFERLTSSVPPSGFKDVVAIHPRRVDIRDLAQE